jgi:LacI family gluconate utilization system Gnt-I transcriptional repressor
MPAPADPAAKPARQRRRGHGSVTLQHVAEAAGVTAITVSRYLRDPARVAEPTAMRVSAALHSTGYVPNKPAGGLASGVSRVVAALLPNLTHSIFAETVQGLSDALQSAGHQLLIAATGYSPAREEEQLRALLGWRPAGVIVTGRHHAPGAIQALAAARDAGVAVVEIWDCPSDTAAPAPAFCQVGFSHEAVGRAMADHLLGRGHRRLAYVDSAVAADRRARERGSAFEDRAREAGAEVLRLVSRPGDPFDAGRAALHELLAAGGRPVTAAAFANDHLACGSSLEAARCGVAVPQRLALLGFGDFPLARQLQPALSSVSLPLYDIGQRAAGALLALHRGEPVVPVQVLPWAVLARASTAAPRRDAGSG